MSYAMPQSLKRQSKITQDNLRKIAFHFLIPLVLVIYTATGTSYHRLLGSSGAFVFVSLFAFIPWWTAEALTRAVKFILAPWRPSLLVLTFTGSVLACIAVILYAPLLIKIFSVFNFSTSMTLTSDAMTAGKYKELIIQCIRAIFLWMAVNFIFDRYLGLPRFRYAPLVAEKEFSLKSTAYENKLYTHLKRFSACDEIWIIKAEEHYVRIIGSQREELILYRFSDALKAVSQDHGLRVHRSYWVRRDKIASINYDTNKRMNLVMENGFTVPVSRRYYELIQQTVRITA